MSLSLRILGTALLDCIPEDQRIPLYLSPVTAGFPPTADDYVDQQINLHELLVHNSAATYFVRAVGDSMLGARVHDGDLLIVDRSAEARSGRVVIAVLEGGADDQTSDTPQGTGITRSGEPRVSGIDITERTHVHIWGVVTYVVHKL